MADTDKRALEAFEAFMKTEAPADYDASNGDAWYVWKACWAAALASRPAAENMVLGKQPEIATETAETRMDTGFHDAGQIASRPAEVDDEGLPPLPESAKLTIYELQREPESAKLTIYELQREPYFTAEQYRQGQRDAVAADRARRK